MEMTMLSPKKEHNSKHTSSFYEKIQHKIYYRLDLQYFLAEFNELDRKRQ